MRAYGYLKGDEDAAEPTELTEVTLDCSVDELRRLRAFLDQVIEKREAAAGGPLAREPSHDHLRDRDPAWKEGDADLILYVGG